MLSAIGLDWQALFPRRLDIETHSLAPSHSRIPARDLLAIVDHEIAVACLILTDVLEQRAVSEAQWQRLAQAAARIGRARDQVSPAEVRHA
ncbi:MAG: hypothetical protein IRZ28_12035 [Steroidobacteraceae bacterium]|nr:hypothetical protein [Steroidobacteraceae bacterium]